MKNCHGNEWSYLSHPLSSLINHLHIFGNKIFIKSLLPLRWINMPFSFPISSFASQIMTFLLILSRINTEIYQQQPEPKAALHMKPYVTDLRNPLSPLITEFPRWVQVNLSDTDHDRLNRNGFIKVGCYRELTGFKPEKLQNRTFRFFIHKKYEGKLCMLRFPTGLRLQYRFEFSDANTYAFFALGHNKNMTVATSRLISKIERENAPFQWWKGVMHVACRFSTFVFHPHAIGEILEFRILDIPYEYVDKCSALEKEYY